MTMLVVSFVLNLCKKFICCCSKVSACGLSPGRPGSMAQPVPERRSLLGFWILGPPFCPFCLEPYYRLVFTWGFLNHKESKSRVSDIRSIYLSLRVQCTGKHIRKTILPQGTSRLLWINNENVLKACYVLYKWTYVKHMRLKIRWKAKQLVNQKPVTERDPCS